jgi:hypothetical protein
MNEEIEEWKIILQKNISEELTKNKIEKLNKLLERIFSIINEKGYLIFKEHPEIIKFIPLLLNQPYLLSKQDTTTYIFSSLYLLIEQQEANKVLSRDEENGKVLSLDKETILSIELEELTSQEVITQQSIPEKIINKEEELLTEKGRNWSIKKISESLHSIIGITNNQIMINKIGYNHNEILTEVYQESLKNLIKSCSIEKDNEVLYNISFTVIPLIEKEETFKTEKIELINEIINRIEKNERKEREEEKVKRIKRRILNEDFYNFVKEKYFDEINSEAKQYLIKKYPEMVTDIIDSEVKLIYEDMMKKGEDEIRNEMKELIKHVLTNFDQPNKEKEIKNEKEKILIELIKNNHEIMNYLLYNIKYMYKKTSNRIYLIYIKSIYPNIKTQKELFFTNKKNMIKKLENINKQEINEIILEIINNDDYHMLCILESKSILQSMKLYVQEKDMIYLKFILIFFGMDSSKKKVGLFRDLVDCIIVKKNFDCFLKLDSEEFDFVILFFVFLFFVGFFGIDSDLDFFENNFNVFDFFFIKLIFV